MKISAIVLASGLSRRMNLSGQSRQSSKSRQSDQAGQSGETSANKLLLPYQGKALLEHVLELAASFEFCQHILVTTEEISAKILLPRQFQLVYNQNPQQGQSASLLLGTSIASGDGYLYFMGDQPLLDRLTVERIIEQARPDNIVFPSFNGRPGNPVFFGKEFRKELLATSGDTGGRALRAKYADRCIEVQAANAKALMDIDTSEDYQRLNAL